MFIHFVCKCINDGLLAVSVMLAAYLLMFDELLVANLAMLNEVVDIIIQYGMVCHNTERIYTRHGAWVNSLRYPDFVLTR